MKAKARIKLEIAPPDDADSIADLRNATAAKLTAEFGEGPWSGTVTHKGVLFAMRVGTVLVVRRRAKIIATLTLSTKKPWAIDTKYFTPAKKPLYLTAMAVAIDRQRTGIGRLCVEAARKLCKDWPVDAIRLDAYNATAGAGPFYEKCGFKEVGRASYRQTPLVYYEMLL